MITKLLNFQQELEDSFKLDCSAEDIETEKEAYKLYKKLKKQRKYVDKIKRIAEKANLTTEIECPIGSLVIRTIYKS